MSIKLPAVLITLREYKQRPKTDIHCEAYDCNGTIKGTRSNAYKACRIYQYDTELTLKK